MVQCTYFNNLFTIFSFLSSTILWYLLNNRGSSILRVSSFSYRRVENFSITTSILYHSVCPLDHKICPLNSPSLFRLSNFNIFIGWFSVEPKDFKLRKMSEALLNLSNEILWEEPASKWSTLHSCNLKILNDTAHIKLHFNMPIRDSKMEVVKALAIPFYNHTNQAGKEICWMTYQGPKHILVNKTNECMTDTINWAEIDQSIRSQTCRDEDDQLHNLGSMYTQDSCTPEVLHIKKRISTYEVNGIHHIYCYPFNITIEGQERCCPDHIFQLEGRRSYSIANFNHIGRYVERTVMKDIDFLINKKIMMKLRQDKIKISAHNTSSLNITKNLNRTLASYMEKLKEIPMKLNLEKNSLSNPFAFITNLVDSIITSLHYATYLVLIIIAGGIIITISPLINLALSIFYGMKYLLVQWLAKIRNQWKSSHNVTKIGNFSWEKKHDYKRLT